jgi:hypothetical protein
LTSDRWMRYTRDRSDYVPTGDGPMLVPGKRRDLPVGFATGVGSGATGQKGRSLALVNGQTGKGVSGLVLPGGSNTQRDPSPRSAF